MTRPGKSRALQHWLEILREGLVLFLDDDVRVSPEVLEVYASAAKQYGANSCYGGPLSIDYEEEPPSWLIPYLPPSARGWPQRWPFAPGRKYYFLGANYGAFTERILSVGGFDKVLGPGAFKAGNQDNPTGEETYLQKRLLEDGCQQVFLPEAKGWHYVPRSSCTPAWALQRIYSSNSRSGSK